MTHLTTIKSVYKTNYEITLVESVIWNTSDYYILYAVNENVSKIGPFKDYNMATSIFDNKVELLDGL